MEQWHLFLININHFKMSCVAWRWLAYVLIHVANVTLFKAAPSGKTTAEVTQNHIQQKMPWNKCFKSCQVLRNNNNKQLFIILVKLGLLNTITLISTCKLGIRSWLYYGQKGLSETFFLPCCKMNSHHPCFPSSKMLAWINEKEHIFELGWLSAFNEDNFLAH